MNICICMYIFMKSSFSKHDLRTWYCYGDLDFWISIYRVLEKSSSYVTQFQFYYILKGSAELGSLIVKTTNCLTTLIGLTHSGSLTHRLDVRII